MNKQRGIKLTPDMIPGQAFHPGGFLLEEIEYRKIKQKDLAEAMNIAANVLSEIIHGKRNLTAELAIKLEKAIDIDAAYWMRLQVKYEIDTIRIKHSKEINHSALSPRQKTHFSKSVFQYA